MRDDRTRAHLCKLVADANSRASNRTEELMDIPHKTYIHSRGEDLFTYCAQRNKCVSDKLHLQINDKYICTARRLFARNAQITKLRTGSRRVYRSMAKLIRT